MTNTQPLGLKEFMRDKIIKILATGFGLGYGPVAPGTFGTILGSLLFYIFRFKSQVWLIEFSVLLAVVSIYIAHQAEKIYKQKDCQKIVIDEVVGVLFCYCFVPYSMFNLIVGFILFRIFDVVKIFPANTAQNKLKGGYGVVCDDLVAGIQAGVLLYFLPTIINWVTLVLK